MRSPLLVARRPRGRPRARLPNGQHIRSRSSPRGVTIGAPEARTVRVEQGGASELELLHHPPRPPGELVHFDVAGGVLLGVRPPQQFEEPPHAVQRHCVAGARAQLQRGHHAAGDLVDMCDAKVMTVGRVGAGLGYCITAQRGLDMLKDLCAFKG
eukprot:4230691-Pyramimonas_sp.AAC.1